MTVLSTAMPLLSNHWGMVPIRIAALFPPTQIKVDLYLTAGDATVRPRLYTRAKDAPPVSHLQKLQQAGMTMLYTTVTESETLHEQFQELLNSGATLSPTMHLEVAREAAKGNMAKAWTTGQADTLISQAAEFASNLIDVCHSAEEHSSLVLSLLQHDGDTFTHISNVCVYTILLLKKLGISDEKQLSSLGQAALLHDLGKRKISKDILKKPGVLTKEERAEISQHPQLGFEELCERADMNRDQLLMVYHHHEKLNGTGYPVGLVGEEIHWTGRLCAVVDVFDALTGHRPYRKPATAEQALDVLQQGIGTHFEEEFVRCWADNIRAGNS